jgi:hypothetical protein
MRWLALFSATAARWAAFSWPTHGQQVCGPYGGITRTLGAQYGEAVRGVGIAGDGRQRLEIWRSADGGSWSVVIVRVDGMTCLVSSGVDWEDVPLGPTPGPSGPPPDAAHDLEFDLG